MKKVIFSLLLLISSFSYGATHWNATSKNPIVVIYKVLDPLVVTVEQPQRIVVPANETIFKYSKYNNGKMLNVKIEAPYNSQQIDDILRKIYERVYLKLQNNGNFDLTLQSKGKIEIEKKINGQGYFIDSKNKATENNKKTEINMPFSSSVAGDKFIATTKIDAEFTKGTDLPMGIYKGTLKLDVWFGGTIN